METPGRSCRRRADDEPGNRTAVAVTTFGIRTRLPARRRTEVGVGLKFWTVMADDMTDERICSI